MKLNVAYFAFASMWHSVLGQEESTFLHGRGAEGTVAEEDKGASFWDFFNSHKQQPPSLFEDDREGIALGLLANLKETPEVKWVCRVKATSIRSVVKGVMVVIPKWKLWDLEKVYKMKSQ